MALLMRVYEADILILEMPMPSALQYSYGLNSSLQFSGELPQNWPNSDLVEVGQVIEVYQAKNRLFTGNLQRFDIQQNGSIKFSGVGLLDAVYDEKIFPLAYYQDKPLLGVLLELLLQVGWRIGDISTLADPDQVTSIDLRTETNLLVQINKLLGGVPEVFYREGDEILGYPSLDIGRFFAPSQIQALSKSNRNAIPSDNELIHWINDLSYQEDLTDVVYALRSLGGNVTDTTGVKRVINLGDALASDVNLLFDPDFPIIEDLAERNWVALNYAEFGSVGGTILSTVDGTAETTIIGDATGGAVDADFWAMFTFVPFPGIFDYFKIWFGAAVGANILTSDITWVLQEISLSDYRTVLATNLATGTFTLGAANSIKKVVTNSDYELVAGKLYGLAIGFAFNPTPDLFNIRVKDRTVSTSYSFKLQTFTSLVGLGGLWNNTNRLAFFEVGTTPIDAPHASFLAEKVPKYAPKNTGANSTATEIQDAGLALYLWTKAYLLDHLPRVLAYNMSTTATENLPKAGDTIYVDSKAQGHYQDPLSRRIVQTSRQVSGHLRVDSVSASINGQEIKVDYKLLDGTGVPRTDVIVDLYDKTENKEPAEGEVAARPWALLLDTLSGVIGPFSPNSVMSDGTLAYRVSFSIFAGAYATRPNDVEEVYLAGLPYGTISPGGTLRIEMVQFPTIANAEVIFDIALQTRDWEYGDVATITVKQVWR